MPENFENFKKVEIATGYDQTSIWDYKNVNLIKIPSKLDFWWIFEVGNKSDENGNAYFVLGNFTYHSTSYYEIMRKLKGFEIFEILEELLHTRENGKFFDTSNGTTRCFLFNPKDGQMQRFLFVAFNFWKNELQQVGMYLEQAGIHRYWQVVENWQRLYIEFVPGNEEGVSFGNKAYSPIPLNSHLQMIFHLLIWAFLFTGIVLASECLGFQYMHRVKQAGKKILKAGGFVIVRVMNGINYYVSKFRDMVSNWLYLSKKCVRAQFRLKSHTKSSAAEAQRMSTAPDGQLSKK
ncbi:hypothetical protein Fcan01_22717 [Folsomia candida]|uniref:Uncharacterized protein n=1 Tax=Folsomia candida TaxID=158441 RepID=A0A226DC30_FOLCA|nr:hypothetical protein Fcan01_22717 [Folsomia candida]